jgi:hypothetical protein
LKVLKGSSFNSGRDTERNRSLLKVDYEDGDAVVAGGLEFLGIAEGDGGVDKEGPEASCWRDKSAMIRSAMVNAVSVSGWRRRICPIFLPGAGAAFP